MSWNNYLENLVQQSQEHIDKACIIGLDGGASWTTDDHANALRVSAEEGATIARAFKSKDFTTFMTNGVALGGVKYQFVREEEKRICYFRKKDEGGVTMQSSNQTVVVAHCPEGKQQGNANKAVNLVAEYLAGQNY